MKRKLVSVGLALVLALSLSLVTAVPVSATLAGGVDYWEVTSPGQVITENSPPTALFKVAITIVEPVDSELSGVKVEFEDVSGFDKTDLAAVSVYRDGVRPYGEPETPFEPGGEDTLIAAGAVNWVGLVAEVTFDTPEPLVLRDDPGPDMQNYFWVAIETSATIANGDQFQATLGTQSIEINTVWEGSPAITTNIITAEAPVPLSQTGEVSMTTTSVTAKIGISVDPTSIDFGEITPGQTYTYPEAVLTVSNIGNAAITVSADIAADTTYASGKYFYTAALKLNDKLCDKAGLPTALGGAWTAEELGLSSIAIGGSEPVTPGLACPSLTKAATTYTGTVVFWAEAAQ
ncbi:hypothetical protein ES703_42477 [subsurface metagenome]